MGKRGPNYGWQHVSFGPPVPATKVTDFTGITREELAAAWRLTGPSVAKNMQRGGPLWEVMAACYSEGAAHAVTLMSKRGWISEAGDAALTDSNPPTRSL